MTAAGWLSRSGARAKPNRGASPLRPVRSADARGPPANSPTAMDNTTPQQCTAGCASSVLTVSQELNSCSSHGTTAVADNELPKPCTSCSQHEQDAKRLNALVEDLQMEKKMLLAKVGGLLFRQSALESELKEARMQAVGSAAGDPGSGRQKRHSPILITTKALSSVKGSCMHVDKQAAFTDGSGTDPCSSEESLCDIKETTVRSRSARGFLEPADQLSTDRISAKQSQASTMHDHLYANSGDAAARRPDLALSSSDRREQGDTARAQGDSADAKMKTTSSSPSSRTVTPTRLRCSHGELEVNVAVSFSRVRFSSVEQTFHV